MGKWNKTTPNYNVQQCYYYYIYRSHSRTIAIDSPRQVSKSDFTAWWHETNFTEAYCSKIHTKVITRISKYLNLICLQMYVNLLIEMYEKGTTHHRQQVWLFRHENAQYRKLAIFLPLWFYVKLTLADIKISHFDNFCNLHLIFKWEYFSKIKFQSLQNCWYQPKLISREMRGPENIHTVRGTFCLNAK